MSIVREGLNTGLGIPMSVWVSVVAAGVGFGVGHGTLRTKQEGSRESMMEFKARIDKALDTINIRLYDLQQTVAQIKGNLEERRRGA